MILNECWTKIKQWWAGMVEQPKPVVQVPVKKPETTVEPVREKSKKKYRSPKTTQTTKKPKTSHKKKETSDRRK